MNAKDEILSLEFLRRQLETVRSAAEPTLKSGDGGGTSGGMSDINVHSRLSRLEGSTGAMQWATALVATVMIGAMAIIVAMQLQTSGKVDALAADVQALPAQINQNLTELTRTMSGVITASKEGSQPTIIVVPTPAAEPPAQ